MTISGITGTVEELAMRTTRLRDDDGKLYILSNGDIGQVCNRSRGPVAGSLEIAVAASADPRTVTETLNTALAQASEEMKLAQPARVEGIFQADATKTTFKVTFRAAGQNGPEVRRSSFAMSPPALSSKPRYRLVDRAGGPPSLTRAGSWYNCSSVCSPGKAARPPLR